MRYSHLVQSIQLQLAQRTVNLKRPAAGLVTGGLWGLLILGGGSRLAMRLVALFAGLTPTGSVTGTLGLFFMGAVAGGVIGVCYALVARWLPFPWHTKGWFFTVIFGALTLMPFVGERTGEAALAPPWIGAPLFVALPVFFCPLLAYTLHRVEPGVLVSPRPVGFVWLLAFVVLLGWVFGNFMALTESMRIPQLVSIIVGHAGVAFHDMRVFLGLWGALLGLLFCALHLLLFWVGVQQPVVKLAGLGQLLLAALLIRTEPLLPWLGHGRTGTWGEWIAWSVLVLCVLVGLLGPWRQPTRQVVRMVVVSFGSGFLLLWLAILLTSTMQLRGWTGIQTAVAVVPYLLVWLPLPATLCWLAWRAVGQFVNNNHV